MRQFIIAIIIALAAVVFALQNSDPVTVKLYFWEVADTSTALVLLITLIIGVISGALFMVSGFYSRNQIIAAQKKRISELEKQLSTMKL